MTTAELINKIYAHKRAVGSNKIDTGCDLLYSIEEWEDDGKITCIEDLEYKFPSEKDCHYYLSAQRWGGFIICPRDSCKYEGKIYHFSDGIRHKCAKCSYIFTARSNTFMDSSNLPTIKWLQAMWLYTHYPKTSSLELHRTLNITQKTAWHMLKKIKWSLE